jgi:AmpD protein
MHINKKTGWLSGVKNITSPNFDQRPNIQDIALLVIHCISLPLGKYGGDQVECFFQNKLDIQEDESFNDIENLKVSAHFFIKRTGEVIQFVSIFDRAWHAGKSRFEDREDCNDFSIGIELEGTDQDAFEAAQYHSLMAVTKAIQTCCPLIIRDCIVGHEKIAPGRKTDPGVGFDWAHYLKGLEG